MTGGASAGKADGPSVRASRRYRGAKEERTVPLSDLCSHLYQTCDHGHGFSGIVFIDCLIMANLYYSQSVNRQGTLRAVLSSHEARCLLSGHPAQYVGLQFPATNQEPGVDFALLRIFEEEANEEWRAGFYRFDDDLTRMEEAIQACTAAPATEGGEESEEPVGHCGCGPRGA
jgi:hypothetical protein